MRKIIKNGEAMRLGKRRLLPVFCLLLAAFPVFSQAPGYGQINIVHEGASYTKGSLYYTSDYISAVYVRKSNTADWGEPVASSQIRQSETTAITFNPGLYDVKVVVRFNIRNLEKDYGPSDTQDTEYISRNVLIRENYITVLVVTTGIKVMPHKKLEDF